MNRIYLDKPINCDTVTLYTNNIGVNCETEWRLIVLRCSVVDPVDGYTEFYIKEKFSNVLLDGNVIMDSTDGGHIRIFSREINGLTVRKSDEGVVVECR